jgi:aldehyde dehydrogenase (NAD+)/betaine-aldehyde dehydrogenase
MKLSGEHVKPDVAAFFENVRPNQPRDWYGAEATTVPVIDPATEETVGQVPEAGPEQVLAAVAAARKAFDSGPWPRMSPDERAARIEALADAIAAHADLLGDIGTLETGLPRDQSSTFHGSAPAVYMRWWSGPAREGPLGGWQENFGVQTQPVETDSTLYREPAGVVAAIAAYNMPLMIASFKVGGAIAAGCTAVLLPSPRTPLNAIVLARLVEEVGIPEGVVNVVIGGAETGEALTSAPGVDIVTFTGSVPVGRKIMQSASLSMKKVVLELGGKAPDVILPGTNLEAIIAPSVARLTRNAGQMCGATTRTLVPRDMLGDYLDLLRSGMGELRMGDPWEPGQEVGPLIREEHRQHVAGFVRRALADGGEVVAGGGESDEPRGFYYNPTLIGNVSPDSEIAQEEVFGPVGVVLPYDGVDQAVEIANNTRFGLNANVWGPTEDALVVARRIRAGTVNVNGGGGERPEAPWPSTGESGIGTDRGMEGFREFFSLRHVLHPLHPTTVE